MRDEREATRLMVVLEPGDGARERLMAAVQAASIACVMLKPDAGGSDRASEASQLLKIARGAGAICLIVDDADLARTLAADGVHLSTGGDTEVRYASARAALSAHGSVGVDAGGSRHVAMSVGEVGADYIAFGPLASIGDTRSGTETRQDLIAWWAEVFELPCVAMDVASPGDARDLELAGADFVAVTLAAGRSPAWVAETIREIAAALGEAALMRPE